MYYLFISIFLQLVQNNAIGSGALEHDPRHLYLAVSKVNNVMIIQKCLFFTVYYTIFNMHVYMF